MTAAQRDAIYGDSSNGARQTSNVSQAQAEAKQKALEREKLHQDALRSDTVAIDFSHPSAAAPAPTAVLSDREQATPKESAEVATVGTSDGSKPIRQQQTTALANTDPMAPYSFDDYQGRLYRVFEGTVLEGVVTNHIDGGLAGPILVMLTTDYYSHDHQQLLMPQGTRLIGTVQSVGNAQQRKMFVTFHRAVCPDGLPVASISRATSSWLSTVGRRLECFGNGSASGR
jgi:type IV secretory pathway VirB10-like protein